MRFFSQFFAALVALFCCFSLVQGGWVVNQNVSATILMGVAVPTPEVIYLNSGNNGVGFQVLKSTDGANTFTPVNTVNTTLFTLSLAAISADDAAVTGLGMLQSPTQVTFDGLNFQLTKEKTTISAANLIRAFPQGYSAAGMFNNKNGISVSLDQGNSWQEISVGSEAIPAVDSALVDNNNWYVLLGSFPNNNQPDPNPGPGPNQHQHEEEDAAFYYPLRKGVSMDVKNTRFVIHNNIKDDNSSYATAVMKTTNGGKSFTQVYNNPNIGATAIQCPDVNTCYFIASDANNGYIYKSTNGGASWQLITEVYNNDLTAIYCFSDSFCRVAGGVVSQTEMVGTVWETQNGGVSWNSTNIQGYAFLSWDFYSPEIGYATAIDQYQQSVLLAYSSEQ